MTGSAMNDNRQFPNFLYFSSGRRIFTDDVMKYVKTDDSQVMSEKPVIRKKENASNYPIPGLDEVFGTDTGITASVPGGLTVECRLPFAVPGPVLEMFTNAIKMAGGTVEIQE